MAAIIRTRAFRALPSEPGAPGPSSEGLRAGPETDFAAAWHARLALTPHANFSMSLEYLAARAACGESSRAVLIDEGTRRGAMVLRDVGAEVVCGFPWRWQMVIEGADPYLPQGMPPEVAAWFFGHAERLAGHRRLRFYAPQPIRPGASWQAGLTVLIELAQASEETLFARLDGSRRRLARRSEKQGCRVIEAGTPELRRSFVALVADTAERRHGRLPVLPVERSEPGEAAAEWAQAWHWLLVGVHEGAVVAGLGLGRYPGAMVDGRASGSTEAAMKVGTNSQVWWEAVRLARQAGHRWVNLGGATVYKRQFGGVLVPIYCRLGGAPWWRMLNLVEKLLHDAVALAVATRRRLRRSGPPRLRDPERSAPGPARATGDMVRGTARAATLGDVPARPPTRVEPTESPDPLDDALRRGLRVVRRRP